MRFGLLLAGVALAACSRGPESAEPAATSAPVVAEAAEPSAEPEPMLAGDEPAAPAIDPLTDRLWTLTPGDGRPGVFRLFLASGAMLQGSCVETYRISEWRRDGAGRIVWTEDGTDISAEIVNVDAAALTLGINLAGGQKVETYAPAAAPFVCPDLPR